MKRGRRLPFVLEIQRWGFRGNDPQKSRPSLAWGHSVGVQKEACCWNAGTTADTPLTLLPIYWLGNRVIGV